MLDFLQVNWWVPVFAVVFNMAVGMLWYGPLFGKPWMKGMGVDPDNADQVAEMQKQAGPGYALSVVFAFVFGYTLELILTVLSGLPGWSLAGALVATLVLYLGLVATNTVKGVLWGEVKFVVFLIGLGYELVSFLAVGTAAFFL